MAAETSIAPCGQSAEDSIYARSAPANRDCSVQKPAKQIPSNVRVDFPPEAAVSNCYAAEVESVVSEAGALEPGTVRVVRTNSQPFAESVVNVLPRWKYDPAMLNGVAVRQIVNLKQSTGVGVVRAARGSGPPPTCVASRLVATLHARGGRMAQWADSVRIGVTSPDPTHP